MNEAGLTVGGTEIPVAANPILAYLHTHPGESYREVKIAMGGKGRAFRRVFRRQLRDGAVFGVVESYLRPRAHRPSWKQIRFRRLPAAAACFKSTAYHAL